MEALQSADQYQEKALHGQELSPGCILESSGKPQKQMFASEVTGLGCSGDTWDMKMSPREPVSRQVVSHAPNLLQRATPPRPPNRYWCPKPHPVPEVFSLPRSP